jgi:two-component system response regulator RegX3
METSRAVTAADQQSHGKPNIAVLDDDTGFLTVLAKRLERREWPYRTLGSRRHAKTVAAMDIDALVIDPAVLGESSWDWLAEICALRPDLALVVVTGTSTVADRVRGLRLGVDDWLSKPCHAEELIARIEAVTLIGRRPEIPSAEPMLIGEVEVRPDQYQAFVDRSSLKLTRREYQLVTMLGRTPGEPVSREDIYEELWGYEMLRNDRSVDVFVHKLRRKLELASPGWRYIHTHFGVGYELRAEQLEPAPVSRLEVRTPEAALTSIAA